MQGCVCITIKPASGQKAKLAAFAAHLAQMCRFVTARAQSQKIKARNALQHAVYDDARRVTGAGAQVCFLAMKQVAASYRRLRKVGELGADKAWPLGDFAPKGSVAFDARRYRITSDGFWLYSLDGRIRVF